ncbi:hypothetical protein KI387_024498, partial [Taxus chinensis]
MKTNKLPCDLVTLEDIFNTEDQLRKVKTKMSTHDNNYEEILVDEGEKLFLGK